MMSHFSTAVRGLVLIGFVSSTLVAQGQPTLKELMDFFSTQPTNTALHLRILEEAARTKTRLPISDEAKMAYQRGRSKLLGTPTPEDIREAIQEYSRAVALAPLWPDAAFGLAYAHERAEKTATALNAYAVYLRF